jgi:hypothetical protein
MDRWRIAAAFVFVWSLLQLRDLLAFWNYEQSQRVPWCFFALCLGILFGLWRRRSWARVAFLALCVVLAGMLIFTLAVFGYACARFWSLCSIRLLAQPLLVAGAMTSLLWPSRLTSGWSGRER